MFMWLKQLFDAKILIQKEQRIFLITNHDSEENTAAQQYDTDSKSPPILLAWFVNEKKKILFTK